MLKMAFFVSVLGSDICRCPSQTKGLALLPKRAVDVMACQVASFMQLTQNAIVPIGYHVQRKVRLSSIKILSIISLSLFLSLTHAFSRTVSSMLICFLILLGLVLLWVPRTGQLGRMNLWVCLTHSIMSPTFLRLSAGRQGQLRSCQEESL